MFEFSFKIRFKVLRFKLILKTSITFSIGSTKKVIGIQIFNSDPKYSIQIQIFNSYPKIQTQVQIYNSDPKIQFGSKNSICSFISVTQSFDLVDLFLPPFPLLSQHYGRNSQFCRSQLLQRLVELG